MTNKQQTTLRWNTFEKKKRHATKKGNIVTLKKPKPAAFNGDPYRQLMIERVRQLPDGRIEVEQWNRIFHFKNWADYIHSIDWDWMRENVIMNMRD